MLPCVEFMIQQFSINWTYVRYFDRNLALFNFCIQVINGFNLILGIQKSLNPGVIITAQVEVVIYYGF